MLERMWKDLVVRGFRVVPIVLSSLLFLSACTSSAELKLAPDSALPAFLTTAAPRVREAYRFAMANPDALKTVPCYCGCGKMGHTSNLSCFVQRSSTNWETIELDEHAAGCGICVDIAQDVMRMTAEGKQPIEISHSIDATYSSFGPATDTPLPNGG
jgi:hypothetical protein